MAKIITSKLSSIYNILKALLMVEYNEMKNKSKGIVRRNDESSVNHWNTMDVYHLS